MVGYRRFEGLEAAMLLAELYRSARLFVNFFQPSFKLIAKRRDGARVRKTYSAPMTPHQRLAADVRTPDEVRARLQQSYAGLDPGSPEIEGGDRVERPLQFHFQMIRSVEAIRYPTIGGVEFHLFYQSIRSASI